MMLEWKYELSERRLPHVILVHSFDIISIFTSDIDLLVLNLITVCMIFFQGSTNSLKGIIKSLQAMQVG